MKDGWRRSPHPAIIDGAAIGSAFRHRASAERCLRREPTRGTLPANYCYPMNGGSNPHSGRGRHLMRFWVQPGHAMAFAVAAVVALSAGTAYDQALSPA